MTPAAIRSKVLDVLGTVVPELEPDKLRLDRPIRDELDFRPLVLSK